MGAKQGKCKKRNIVENDEFVYETLEENGGPPNEPHYDTPPPQNPPPPQPTPPRCVENAAYFATSPHPPPQTVTPQPTPPRCVNNACYYATPLQREDRVFTENERRKIEEGNFYANFREKPKNGRMGQVIGKREEAVYLEAETTPPQPPLQRAPLLRTTLQLPLQRTTTQPRETPQSRGIGAQTKTIPVPMQRRTKFTTKNRII